MDSECHSTLQSALFCSTPSCSLSYLPAPCSESSSLLSLSSTCQSSPVLLHPRGFQDGTAGRYLQLLLFPTGHSGRSMPAVLHQPLLPSLGLLSSGFAPRSRLQASLLPAARWSLLITVQPPGVPPFSLQPVTPDHQATHTPSLPTPLQFFYIYFIILYVMFP